jgi:hypothetical protein
MKSHIILKLLSKSNDTFSLIVFNATLNREIVRKKPYRLKFCFKTALHLSITSIRHEFLSS